jgi:hypothetical protein
MLIFRLSGIEIIGKIMGFFKNEINHPVRQPAYTPPLKGGEIIDILHYNFLLLFKEEYPDRSVRGRWLVYLRLEPVPYR